MATIDRFAPKKGKNRDKENLIRIKKFVHDILIPHLEIDVLNKLSLFEAFKFIIVNGNPKKTEQIIK